MRAWLFAAVSDPASPAAKSAWVASGWDDPVAGWFAPAPDVGNTRE